MRPPIRPRMPGEALAAPVQPPPAPEPPPTTPATPTAIASAVDDLAAQTLAAAKARLAVLQPEVNRLQKLIAALET